MSDSVTTNTALVTVAGKVPSRFSEMATFVANPIAIPDYTFTSMDLKDRKQRVKFMNSMLLRESSIDDVISPSFVDFRHYTVFPYSFQDEESERRVIPAVVIHSENGKDYMFHSEIAVTQLVRVVCALGESPLVEPLRITFHRMNKGGRVWYRMEIIDVEPAKPKGK